jgi:hypothetical protein
MAEQGLFEAQKELLSSTFGQAQTYTNVVLAAGYAGYFGVWSFVRNDLGRATMFASALLITISLGAFVLWEVIGMYMRNSVLIRLASVVADEEQFAVRLAAYKKERQDQNIRLIPVWKVVLAITVLTAVVAYFILLSAFVHGLWLASHGP